MAHPYNPYGATTATQYAGLPVGDDIETDRRGAAYPPQTLFPEKARNPLRTSWSRFNRSGKKRVGIFESLIAIVLSTWMNIFLVFLPLGWASHFIVSAAEKSHHETNYWSQTTTFTFCFLGIMPLQKLFEYAGEQMTCYVGVDVGDLLVITLNNVVEATLAIILLAKHELKLLQSTVIGVVILHLLLVPGVSFLVGGARLAHQELHPRFTQLNQTLLSIGVLTLVLPAAVFAALDRPVLAAVQVPTTPAVSDSVRHTFLFLSRALAIVLLVVYICSRIFLHNPPGEDEEAKRARLELVKEHSEEPEVNQYVCIVVLALSIGLMAVTMEWLVETVDSLRDRAGIREWFGLILLPFLSFAADGVIAVYTFIRHLIRVIFKGSEPPPIQAKARAIDLSIQFLLFWMPIFVLLGWCMGRPLLLLFDFFEVAIIVCACFVVNYVVADAKTNWAEGLAMVAFYLMIAASAWNYPGEQSIRFLLAEGSVEEALAEAAKSNATG